MSLITLTDSSRYMSERRFFIHCLKRSLLPSSVSTFFRSSFKATTFNSVGILFKLSICFTRSLICFCSSRYFFIFSVYTLSFCFDSHSALFRIRLKEGLELIRELLACLIGLRSRLYLQLL